MSLFRRSTYFLWLLCCILAGAIVFVFRAPSSVPEVRASDGQTGQDVSVVGQNKTAESFDNYESVFLKHDLFQSLMGFVREPDGAKGQEEDARISGESNFSAGRYKVVGIVIDQEKSQAVLEDMMTKNTLFVSVGDQVESATVQKILPGKIYLEVNGQIVGLAQ